MRATLRQGLHGWEVTDCTVTMTHSGYWPRQSHSHATFDKSMSSTAGDFRDAHAARADGARCAQAGTRGATSRCTGSALELPADALGPLCPAWRGCGARAGGAGVRGEACMLEGTIPAARVHELQQPPAGADPRRGRAGVARSTATRVPTHMLAPSARKGLVSGRAGGRPPARRCRPRRRRGPQPRGNDLGVQVVRFTPGTSPTAMRRGRPKAGARCLTDLSALNALAVVPKNARTFAATIKAEQGVRPCGRTMSIDQRVRSRPVARC